MPRATLRLERHDDVTRLAFASPAGRLAGYAASVYLVDRAERAGADPRPVLVDTAFPHAEEALLAALSALTGGPLRDALAGALLTHAHEDHAGNAARLAALGVPLAMGSATRAALADVAPLALYRRVTWGAMTPLRADPAPFDPAPLALHPAPGHAPDHHVAWDAERETLFGGDLFLGVKVRIAHLEEDLPALARSLHAAAALRPRRLFDGHRGLVPDPVPALEAKAAWVEDTVAAVARLLDAGWPARRVRDAVLGREELTGWLSRGAYSRLGFVRAVAAARGAAPSGA
jgi:glyoxylase-like metal-dependent hydrolase (beta-lactamase superfamily II)